MKDYLYISYKDGGGLEVSESYAVLAKIKCKCWYNCFLFCFVFCYSMEISNMFKSAAQCFLAVIELHLLRIN